MLNDSTNAGSTHQNRKNGKADPGDRKETRGAQKEALKTSDLGPKNGEFKEKAKTGATRGTSLKPGRPLRFDVLGEARKAAAELLTANPKMPGAEMAETLVRNQSKTLATNLSEILMLDFYANAIRVERIKRESRPEQLTLPGFEHLPPSIPVRKGVAVPLLDARLPRVRAWYRSLLKAAKNSPKVKEAKDLVDKLSKKKGATVREVLGIDGKSDAARA